MSSSKYKNFYLIVGLFFSIFLSYFYVVNGDFIGDDVDRIVFNSELFSYMDVLRGSLADRPLLMIYITTLFKLVGLNTTVYHVLNYLLHALVAFQLYLLLAELIGRKLNEYNKYVPMLMAFLFALHPLNSQAVTTAIQSAVMMSAIGAILSIRYFIKYIDTPNNRNLGYSLLFFLIACLAKPNISFLPIFFYFGFKLLSKIEKKEWNYLGLMVAVLSIPVGYYSLAGKNLQNQSLSSFEYFMAQTEVIFTYFRLMIFPYGLSFLKDFTLPENLFLSWNMVFLAAHIGLFTLVYRSLPTAIAKLLWVGFYLTFLPESSFFAINHKYFEHRTYVSLIFVSLLLGVLIADKLNEVRRPIFTLVSIVVGIIFVLLNQFRNLEIKRWGDWALNTLQNSSEYPATNFNLSYYLLKAGYHEQITPLLESYKKFDSKYEFSILFEIADYYKHPEKKTDYLETFSDYLLRKTIINNSRFILNKILIFDFGEPGNDLNHRAHVTYVLAKQLKLFFANRAQFQTSLFAFYKLSNDLLAENNGEEMKKLDIYKYVVVKLALVLYFNSNFPELEDELKLALTEVKDEFEKKDLTYLLGQLRSIKKL